MGQFMAEKPVRRGKTRGRRLETLDIGDEFCTNMNIKPDTAPEFKYGQADGELGPSKPCTEGTGNCPGSTRVSGEYTGSIFKLGNNAVSFDDGNGQMQYLVAWGWTNEGSKTNWDIWMATCLYTTYERALSVNEKRDVVKLEGTEKAVQCLDCFVDLSAKVTIAFKYLYNNDPIAQPGDDFQEYDIQIKAEGGFEYNLDFSMQAPEFSLGQDDWQITEIPKIDSLTFPVYRGVSPPGQIDFTIQPSGDVRTKGKISSSGGSFEATASLDTNINAWATYDDENNFKMGYGTKFGYEPLRLASKEFALKASTELSLGLAPDFLYALKVSLGEYGCCGQLFELSTTLLLDLGFVVKAEMKDDTCKTTYEVDTEVNFGIIAFGDEGQSDTVDVLKRRAEPYEFDDLLTGSYGFCPQTFIGSGDSSASSSGGDDDEGLDAASTAGICIALIVVCVAVAAGYVLYDKRKKGLLVWQKGMLVWQSPSSSLSQPDAGFDDDAKAVVAEAVVADDIEDAKPVDVPLVAKKATDAGKSWFAKGWFGSASPSTDAEDPLVVEDEDAPPGNAGLLEGPMAVDTPVEQPAKAEGGEKPSAGATAAAAPPPPPAPVVPAMPPKPPPPPPSKAAAADAGDALEELTEEDKVSVAKLAE